MPTFFLSTPTHVKTTLRLFFSFIFFFLFPKKWAWAPTKKKKNPQNLSLYKKEIFGNLSKIIGARAGKLWESNSFSFFLSLSSLLCYSPANKKVRNWKNWFERIEVTLTHVVSSPLSYLKTSNIFPVLSLSLSFFFYYSGIGFVCVFGASESVCLAREDAKARAKALWVCEKSLA